jgi:hypothetical protein
MHLDGVDYRTAVAWLQQHLTVGAGAIDEPTVPAPGGESSVPLGPGMLRLPTPDGRMLGRVRRYLTQCRRLGPSLIEPLIQAGRLYADSRGNAVFLLVAGKRAGTARAPCLHGRQWSACGWRPVGAELRGTGPRVWRGLAPGTCKDLGYFWIGVHDSRQIVLCESAIDAMSCFQIYPQRICISTAGIRTNPPWLSGLVARGYELYCGFDADGPGDAAAARMMALHPVVDRLRPPAHDWNDALVVDR